MQTVADPEMELFRIQHDNLSAKIRAQEAGLKDILLHRAMTDFLHGRLDKHALYNRLAHIEARS
jgi:LytS/YehU family sensor histidine kinase